MVPDRRRRNPGLAHRVADLVEAHDDVAGGEQARYRGPKMIVDDHLETTVPGLFAAGDVVVGLDQISHAMGQAGVAATRIRNYLAAQRPLRR